MLQLNIEDIAAPSKRGEWESAGVVLPGHDIGAVSSRTIESPTWLHLGAGNIFRGFIAGLQQKILNRGETDRGIIAAETFDYDIVDRVCAPHDNTTLFVGLPPDGGIRPEVIASVCEAIRTDIEMDRLRDIFRAPSLQMVSLTVTEGGYALTGRNGELTSAVRRDISNGPDGACHVMSIVTSMLIERFIEGGAPLALVSMDNCSRNGERLRDAVLTIAREWRAGDVVDKKFVEYLEDEDLVSFPWSMIDKITPHPSNDVFEMLTSRGIADMAPITTPRGTTTAPFVNAEVPQYLVIEDRFPAGRPPLEGAGVYFTDRKTVNSVERMKSATCLHPLHTALAICGCLLGYASIASGMRDPVLKALAERIGRVEGLPAVTDPGILSPAEFLREALEDRLPNPLIPDSPRRIAADTSLKLPVRFGGTIEAYMRRPDLDAGNLIGIPLVIAAWFRYLLGTDDKLAPMEVSGDPMLPEIRSALAGIEAGKPESYGGELRPFLSNPAIFAVDLYEAGIGDRTESFFVQMLEGLGAVLRTLETNLRKG
jgi:fructuronate reductase